MYEFCRFLVEFPINWKMAFSVWIFVCLCTGLIRSRHGYSPKQVALSVWYGSWLTVWACIVVVLLFAIIWGVGAWATWVAS